MNVLATSIIHVINGSQTLSPEQASNLVELIAWNTNPKGRKAIERAAQEGFSCIDLEDYDGYGAMKMICSKFIFNGSNICFSGSTDDMKFLRHHIIAKMV